jgi:hypothetical protein
MPCVFLKNLRKAVIWEQIRGTKNRLSYEAAHYYAVGEIFLQSNEPL